jgi:hypothetical protein
MKSYIFNLETTKIELHFGKSEYNALTDEQKAGLKSAYLWSRAGSCWVSRAKEPNLWRAKQVAARLGFTEEQREGERLSFSEQVGRQADRAESRAERYDQYAANAGQRGKNLQKPLDGMRGDIAFFTQPIMAGHSGSQAFARRREKMYEQYSRGFDEYRKSEYFRDRAQPARETADGAKYRDVAYLDRRIRECKKEIKDREKNIIRYEETLFAIENGVQRTGYDGAIITVDKVTGWIEREIELVEKAMDKQAYLENCLDECGGFRFSKENIKVGYHVVLDRGTYAEVIGTGPLNFTYRILTGGAAGMTLQAAYAEIHDIKKVDVKREIHPFVVGERFTIERRTYAEGSFKCTRTNVTYEIIKASDTMIQLKPVDADGKPITRKPKKSYNGDWCFSVDDTFGNTFYKAAAKITNGGTG